MGAAFGIYEETYGFVPVVMSLSVALGYDPFYGAITVLGGMATGYAAASINPYTVAIAQTIGELPLFSGMAFRWICYLCFMTFFLTYMCRYGRMVKADPTKATSTASSSLFYQHLHLLSLPPRILMQDTKSL